MKTSMTKEQIANAKKQAWTAYYSAGRVNATVMYYAGLLPADMKQELLYSMEHPEVEEIE